MQLDAPINFGKTVSLSGVSFDQAVARVNEELAKVGFGVLTEIDLKDKLKEKLDIDFRRYLILGACNPVLAHRLLEEEPQVGLLMPCNVCVQQQADSEPVIVSFQSPTALVKLLDSALMREVTAEAEALLDKALTGLANNA